MPIRVETPIQDTRILVVAATARELAPADGWLALQCGVGPVEAAAATATAIALHQPSAILHVGIAGARRGRKLAPPAMVIGSESVYCDVSADSAWTPRSVSASPSLLATLRSAFPAMAVRTIGTTARVGGTSHPHAAMDAGIHAATHSAVDSAMAFGLDSALDVEAMEGFGVLRAAQLAGIPAIEVRAISNDIEEDDRARWRFDEAFAAITAITPLLVAAIQQSLHQSSSARHA